MAALAVLVAAGNRAAGDETISLCLPTGWAMQALHQLISFGSGFDAVLKPMAFCWRSARLPICWPPAFSGAKRQAEKIRGQFVLLPETRNQYWRINGLIAQTLYSFFSTQDFNSIK